MPRFHTVKIDGLSVFYREAGDPEKPTILLLHGFPASSFMYRDLIRLLENDFHVIAPDYPGFGHSDAPRPTEFDYTFDRLTDVVERLTEHLGLTTYALYMQDFGGPVGFRLATRHPERVSFLVVQNANAYEEGLPDSFWGPLRELWADPSPANRARIADAGMSAEALRWNYTHGVADPAMIDPDNWLLQEALLNRGGNKEAMLELLYDYRTNPALYPRWQEYFRVYQPPTLVVWGRNDIVFPESGAHPFARDVRVIDLHLLDTGHFALEDHSGEIAAHIRRFADRL
nr:alpha/beta hydrolase [Kibdelosporangium sp. MJ126-NF4]CEL22905.1 Alpha/beta hydrolase fold precursor [Kibdelosporangium sp. MJ126-NF4]CTQ90045.1 Alpha/beta hydrolase fold precursor [Kibdelosporangium sp. MJ126-NF4]